MGHLTDIPIVILAAGGSTRMGGRDKLMETVDGRPLIRRQAELARNTTTGDVLVALPPAPHPRYDALAGTGVVMVPVAKAAEGMGTSLRTAFANIPQTAPAALLLLGDLPDITREDLGTVLSAIDSDNLVWRGATADGKPGHPIVFSRKLFDAFRDLTGDNGGNSVISAVQDRVVAIPLPGTHARRDLDTPQDWSDWRADNPKRAL